MSGLRLEFLGTGGGIPTPRPLCRCRVCLEAREKGVPYSRSGPSLFVHGPDVLIDTPAEINYQLNRSEVERIAACFYSHWHPDHTMGRHVFSTINVDYRVWPYRPRGTVDVYLPGQVGRDARRYLALWEHLEFLEQKERVVRVHELNDDESVTIGDTLIRPLPLAHNFVYAFLFERGDKRLLIVADEIGGWEPLPEARGVDLAVVPMGIAEFDPLTGERRISQEHAAVSAEATFLETLQIVEKMDAGRVLMSHIEESDGLSYDDLLELERRLRGDGLNVSFAHDTLTVDV